MKFKEGVYTRVTKIVDGVEKVVKPCKEILAAMVIADEISVAVADVEIVITSILDGDHMQGSKHYTGEAFDMRKRCYDDSEQKSILEKLIMNLGTDFDVVNESTHFHIEYDPK